MQRVFFSATPKWEAAMEKHRMHYETLLKVTQAISMSKGPEHVVVATVETVKTALKAKGAALFPVNNSIHGEPVSRTRGKDCC